MHPVLERQLRKHGFSETTLPNSEEQWTEFLKRVDRVYKQADEERYTLERSIEISSAEMSELYESLKKSSESILAKERDKLSAVIAALGEGLCVLTEDGIVTYTNPEACQLLELDHGKVIGAAFHELIQVDEKNFPFPTLDHAQRISRDVELTHEDGAKVPISYTVSPIIHVNKELVGAVVVFRDVTLEHQAQKTVERARDKALENAKAKSDFLATMSHEIRTPLNGIVSIAELLQRSELDEEQKEDVITMQSCAFSLRSIINNVLDFSKLEAGKLFIDQRPFNIRKTSEQLVVRLGVQMLEKQQVCILKIADEVPEKLVGDSLRIEQILTNLVGNAIKFTNENGAIIIYVNASSISPEEATLRFSVADTGIGIPPDKQKNVFKAFIQADGSTTREFGGTGLGLSICTRLLEMMNGHIWLESKPDVGSVFHFELPFGRTVSSVLASEDVSDIRKKIAQTNIKEARALRILLAEDNSINQDTISRMLQTKGHEVKIAVNGVEAVEMVEQQNFDIVLMDLHMPRMGGLEATQLIRAKVGRCSEIPIVALTAHAITGVKESCLQAGMNGYVSKPIDYDELFSVIQEVANRKAT